MPTQAILTEFIIPHLASQPDWLLDPLIDFVFDQAPVAGKEEAIRQLSSVPFVTACDKGGRPSPKRLKPFEVIDKTSVLAKLYFDDEQVFGSGTYSAGGAYHQNLVLLGMKSHFDVDIAEERIECYYKRNADDHELFGKCSYLLTCLNNSESEFQFKDEWLPHVRIPATKKNNRTVLHPSECRPTSFSPLVKGVLGIVSMHVQDSLTKAFGWDSDIGPDIISSRIRLIISQTSASDIQRDLYPVFEYLNSIASRPDRKEISDYVSRISSDLAGQAWLPGSIAGLWPPERVFFRDAREFEPHLSELPIVWSSNLKEILELFNVVQTPSADTLVGFISALNTKTPLSDHDMKAVILALQRVESDFDSSILATLMIPDVQGNLLRMDEFLLDSSASNSSARYAHPKVPSTLAFKCGIPQIEDDLSLLQYLNRSDDFEEYIQEENIVTRISKTVKESSLWTSLNEFVANAEDCGSASKVTWILDSEKSTFPSKHIFCKELKAWQIPSLYIYNDGVFSDSDFKALVNIGMGSKSEDASKIGKYGLGSLSMYLFTDVPSMISGEYFIIFDPTRKHLPFDSRNRRRQAGMRLPLSQMKSRFADHLIPFVGIGGYNLGTKIGSNIFC